MYLNTHNAFCRFYSATHSRACNLRSPWVQGSLFMSKISTLHAWFARSLLKVRVPLSLIKLEKKEWNKIVLSDTLCYTVKRRKYQTSPIKWSTFTSLRDAFNFLPWLSLIPLRNDFEHMLGNHFWTVSRASHNQQNNAFYCLNWMELITV